jgi:hypothetical protein
MEKFPLGKVVATPGALKLLTEQGLTPTMFIQRHASADWGDISREDWMANDQALINGERLLSAYSLGQDRLWILTEADRSSTCVLLPHEY